MLHLPNFFHSAAIDLINFPFQPTLAFFKKPPQIFITWVRDFLLLFSIYMLSTHAHTLPFISDSFIFHICTHSSSWCNFSVANYHFSHFFGVCWMRVRKRGEKTKKKCDLFSGKKSEWRWTLSWSCWGGKIFSWVQSEIKKILHLNFNN